MRSKKNIHQFIIVILLMSMAMVSCKKKKKDVFPDPVDNGSNTGLTTIKSLPFADDFNYTGVAQYAMPTNGNWLEANVDGFKSDRGWGYAPTYGKNSTGCLGASAYGGASGTDNAYLVTGPFNFSSYPAISMSFDIQRFDGYPPVAGKTGNVKVKYSTNYSGSGNPEAATWNEITDITPKIPTFANSGVWTKVVSNLSTIQDAKVYIAFHWKDGNSSNSTTFDLDNVVITNSILAQPCTPATTAGSMTLPFSEDFEFGTDIDNYAIPCDYYEAVVTGAKTDRGWGYTDSYGKSYTGGMSASAYGGAAGTDNAYFVLGTFNFTATKAITFDAALPFTGAGTLVLRYSTNYTGSGDPQAAGVTWTDITMTGLPTNSTWTTVSASIGAVGNAYVAFQYTGGTNAGSCTYNIDNIAIQ